MGDVRNIGSGNIGATNVLRTGNKGLAAGTLLLDLLKGFAPVFAAGLIWAGDTGDVAKAFAAGGAVIGHCYPIWLKFKGTYDSIISVRTKFTIENRPCNTSLRVFFWLKKKSAMHTDICTDVEEDMETSIPQSMYTDAQLQTD